MPRFVVLTHDYPLLHWDFMLENEAALRTWRLGAEPGGESPIEATPLPDHRLAYLDYEGPVSGNRGNVVRWDRGTYSLEQESPELLVVQLQGSRLQGRVVLSHRPDDEGATRWVLEWVPSQGSLAE